MVKTQVFLSSYSAHNVISVEFESRLARKLYRGVHFKLHLSVTVT